MKKKFLLIYFFQIIELNQAIKNFVLWFSSKINAIKKTPYGVFLCLSGSSRKTIFNRFSRQSLQARIKVEITSVISIFISYKGDENPLCEAKYRFERLVSRGWKMETKSFHFERRLLRTSQDNPSRHAINFLRGSFLFQIKKADLCLPFYIFTIIYLEFFLIIIFATFLQCSAILLKSVNKFKII